MQTRGDFYKLHVSINVKRLKNSLNKIDVAEATFKLSVTCKVTKTCGILIFCSQLLVSIDLGEIPLASLPYY